MDELNLLLNGKNYYYIMHLSHGKDTIPTREELWNLARKKEMIGLSHYLVKGPWNDEDVQETASCNGLSPKWRSQFDIFYQMEEDDIVVILSGQDSILGVAKVIQEPKYDLKLEDKFFSHCRRISWKRDYAFDERIMISPVKGFVNSLDRVKQGTKRWANLMTVKLP